MNEVTQMLTALSHGDPHAARRLLPQVYDELRGPGHCAVGKENV
jgi:ECF sigma factor